MTHLSTFSYLDRLVSNLILFPLFLYYVLIVHRGLSEFVGGIETLKKNMRGVVFILLTASYLTVIIYDSLATMMKYREGFVDTCLLAIDNETNTTKIFRYPKEAFVNKDTGMFSYAGPERINASFTNNKGCGIKTTPASLYTQESLDLLPVIDMLWNLSCTLRNSGIFLLLAIFNSTVKSLFVKPLMHRNRIEVQIFTIYGIASLAVYFILPSMFADPLISTISTQILWSVELIVASFMLLLTNVRINRLLQNRENCTGGSDQVGTILSFTKFLNTVLAVTCLNESIALLALNIDILTTGRRTLYHSMLFTDIFTKWFNFFFIIEPFLVTMILYKPPLIQRVCTENRTYLPTKNVQQTTAVDISSSVMTTHNNIHSTNVA